MRRARCQRSNKATVFTRTPECGGNISSCATFDKLLAYEHCCSFGQWTYMYVVVCSPCMCPMCRGIAPQRLAVLSWLPTIWLVPSRSPSFTRHRLRQTVRAKLCERESACVKQRYAVNWRTVMHVQATRALPATQTCRHTDWPTDHGLTQTHERTDRHTRLIDAHTVKHDRQNNDRT